MYGGYKVKIFKKKEQTEKLENIEKTMLMNDNMVFLRYSYDVWKKIHPNHSYEDWENAMCIDDLFTFLLTSREDVMKVFRLRPGRGFPIVRVLPMDDEYLDWLKENNFEHSYENMEKYEMIERTDEEYFRLLCKNGWDKDFGQMCIPLIILNKGKGSLHTDFKLSKETTEMLKEYLESVYIGMDVFVNGQILHQDEYMDDTGMYLNMAKAYFKDGQRVKLGKWDSQQHDSEKINVYEFAIPFVVQKKYDSAVFDLDELQKNPLNFIPDIHLTKDAFDIISSSAEPFADSKIEQRIIKDLKQNNEELNVFVEDMVWYKDTLEHYMKMFRDELEKSKQECAGKEAVEEC